MPYCLISSFNVRLRRTRERGPTLSDVRPVQNVGLNGASGSHYTPNAGGMTGILLLQSNERIWIKSCIHIRSHHRFRASLLYVLRPWGRVKAHLKAQDIFRSCGTWTGKLSILKGRKPGRTWIETLHKVYIHFLSLGLLCYACPCLTFTILLSLHPAYMGLFCAIVRGIYNPILRTDD
jgi:hypothetical protein